MSSADFMLSVFNMLHYAMIAPKVLSSFFCIFLVPHVHVHPKIGIEVRSLRVGIPSPRGKMGGRERLRRAGTNRDM